MSTRSDDDIRRLADIIAEADAAGIRHGAWTLARYIADRWPPAPTCPQFTIKATDELAVETVLHYLVTCTRRHLTDQAGQVTLALAEIRDWQHDHPDRVHVPDHPHRPWQPPADDPGALR